MSSQQERRPLLADKTAETDSVDPDVTDVPLSCTKKLGFGFGAPPNQLTHTLIGFQLNFFLLNYIGLQPSVVGGIVLAGRAWDAIMDPTVGVMTTRTRSRWGSLKPWLAGGILPLAVSYTAIWAVPPWFSVTEQTLFVTACYLMYQLSISMYFVPYTALTMHLSHRPRDIDSGTMYRMVSECLAVFVAALLFKIIAPVQNSIQADCERNPDSSFCVYNPGQLAFMVQGTIVSIACVFCGLAVLSTVSEQKLPPGTAAPPDPFIKGFGKVIGTRSYRVLTMMFLWIWMAVAVIQANFLLFCTIVLEFEADTASDFLLTLLGTTVLTMPAWFAVMISIGKKKTYIIALGMMLPVVLGFDFLDKGSSAAEVHVAFAALGLSLSAVYLVPAAMLPDVINEAALRDHGIRREALFYSYFVFFQKFGAGVSIYISNQILETYGGYDSKKSAADNVNARPTLRLLTAVVPAIMLVISLVFAFFYPLNSAKEQDIKTKLAILRDELHAGKATQTNLGGETTDV